VKICADWIRLEIDSQQKYQWPTWSDDDQKENFFDGTTTICIDIVVDLFVG
jgi:hypothetical protein